jgi:membrane protein required for colicin V production
MQMAWVDAVLLGLLVLSVLLGLWRGFTFELLSLLGWVAAFFAAQWFTPQVAAQLPVGTPGGGLNAAVAFGLCFFAALLVWGLLARLVRLLVRATPLSVVDRVLGAGFGALRGLVLLLALAVVVGLTPAAGAPAWQASQAAPWLAAIVSGLKPLLPAQVAGLLPA